MAVVNQVAEHQLASGDDVVASNAPTAKVVAASGGSAIGGALGTIITWVLISHMQPPPVPPEVHAAIAAVVTAICGALIAGLSGYFIRPQPHTEVIYDSRNRPRIARRAH